MIESTENIKNNVVRNSKGKIISAKGIKVKDYIIQGTSINRIKDYFELKGIAYVEYYGGMGIGPIDLYFNYPFRLATEQEILDSKVNYKTKNMTKAYIVKLIDGDNDTTMKLVDQETWNWIMLDKSGQPSPTKVKNFLGFTKNEEINQWDDKLCPESIRERIKILYENEGGFTGVWITSGSWDNDRAIFAPALEDNYEDFYTDYANTSSTIKMRNKAKKIGYNVDIENEYQGVMY